MTRSKVIQIWLAAVLLVAISGVRSGAPVTMSTVAVLLAMCLVPPAVVLVLWPTTRPRWWRRFTTRGPVRRSGELKKFDWLTHRGLTTQTASSRVEHLVRDNRPVAGEYELLHKYLRDRYSDRVVLTFGELEDLLGFSLPALARVHVAWWDGGDFVSAPSTQSFAWRLAGRTATVNLPAQSVVFERDTDT
jgi:hypothetical protein